MAREERKIKDVTIPAGAAIAVNVMSLMREEEFFPQPELFRPERSVPLQHIPPTKRKSTGNMMMRRRSRRRKKRLKVVVMMMMMMMMI